MFNILNIIYTEARTFFLSDGNFPPIWDDCYALLRGFYTPLRYIPRYYILLHSITRYYVVTTHKMYR